MMKNICILGSTGSIGTQALQVVKFNKDHFKIVGLAARSNLELMEKQIRLFHPHLAALEDEGKAKILKEKVKDTRTKVLAGQQGILQLASMPESDMVLSSIVGIAGLLPTLEAVKAEKDIALANKESLVTAGSILTKSVKKHGVNLIPVDGEHNAVFQCLAADKKKENLNKIILTASGGPFRNTDRKALHNVSPQQALKHPNWSMGKRITIDSATLMNKGFEVIEARWLFHVDVSKIHVVIHPESIVHSMVEFVDSSILAHLSVPDMRLQIQFAFTYPERMKSPVSYLDLIKTGQLNFQEADTDKFPCLKYAYQACETGGTMPTVLNGADEVAVDAFIKGKIGFMDIPAVIMETMSKHNLVSDPSLDDVIFADKWSRDFAKETILGIG
ncbi:1-deoxy-D-xylulose-5-phosphate reductoisomerase [Candidatus Poribacteria bacterium]|nr:1-deoxy-D-xylulose-5-phosphate reductoisomerase [Candidatus Poribacteria bacterium]